MPLRSARTRGRIRADRGFNDHRPVRDPSTSLGITPWRVAHPRLVVPNVERRTSTPRLLDSPTPRLLDSSTLFASRRPAVLPVGRGVGLLELLPNLIAAAARPIGDPLVERAHVLAARGDRDLAIREE